MPRKQTPPHSEIGPPAILDSWAGDPVLFAQEALGINPWEKQAELLRLVAAEDRVAVRSGHKIGKSISAAILALWFCLTRPRSRVVLVSASFDQVKDILWREVRSLWVMANARGFRLGSEPALDPSTGLKMETGDIRGISTNRPERAAGVSGSQLFYILDEASGIEEAILEAIEGNRAGGAKLVMFSNPTRTSGTFFDAFHSKAEFWTRLHVSSEQTPNALSGTDLIPGLATRAWIEEKKREWSTESALYQVRVAGNFPSQGSDAVVSLEIVESARDRYVTDVGDGPLRLGVDPSRFGDDEFVIAPVRGRRAFPAHAFHNLDGIQGAGKILAVARDLKRHDEKPVVVIDVIGIGASVYDQLKHSEEVDVVAVNVAEAPTFVPEGEPGFSALRDQLWFGLRDWLRSAAIPDDSRLDGELVAPTFRYDLKGRIKVEDKASMKKRLGRSPDRADALALAVYEPPRTGPIVIGGAGAQFKPWAPKQFQSWTPH